MSLCSLFKVSIQLYTPHIDITWTLLLKINEMPFFSTSRNNSSSATHSSVYVSCIITVSPHHNSEGWGPLALLPGGDTEAQSSPCAQSHASCEAIFRHEALSPSQSAEATVDRYSTSARGWGCGALTRRAFPGGIQWSLSHHDLDLCPVWPGNSSTQNPGETVRSSD